MKKRNFNNISSFLSSIFTNYNNIGSGFPLASGNILLSSGLSDRLNSEDLNSN